MQSIDIYEMIEDILAQAPYNLPEDDGRRQELVYDLVGHIPNHVFATALREVVSLAAARHDDEPDADEYDDSMDGDHASALASCGWGTDEDYGYYGGDEW